jgi:hypothetical protein
VADLVIKQGETFTHDITVVDTAGRTYTAPIADRHWNRIDDFTVEIVDATTVRLSLTDAETAAILPPANLRHDERSGLLGYYDLTEDDGTSATRIYEGGVILSRSAEHGRSW